MYDDIDLGNLTSREIGELMTKPEDERDKELVNIVNLNQEVHYGGLPLTALGKQVVINETN
ncbi:hypothetical protein [Clostridium aminobutyricum]|uniref:Uncharacterized protein n=1 Tax=Clostridium aminobutyricum TaxID=33953 RepID=A0A939D773_CLOAM|nr:hypothetical protein [Clostridium aminobutyricum]MBN7772380.1 hypothetical protein [Clostridium aminobutyricum]